MNTIKVKDKEIIISGVGKLFYETGFPISMTIEQAETNGLEVSVLHVADECLKNGWSAKTTFTKLKEDFKDSQNMANFDFELLKEFCFADYEKQREMIFEYLFNSDYNLAKSCVCP